MDVEVDHLRRGRVVGALLEERLDRREHGARELRDDPRVAELLEVDPDVVLDLDELPNADAGGGYLVGDGRDAAPFGHVDRVSVDGHEPDGEGRHVDKARDAPRAVAKDLPIGVAGDLEILARASPQVDERVVEAGELEEVLEARLLDARELRELLLPRRDLLGRGLERRARGELPSVLEREALEQDRIGDALVGVVRLEIDGGLKAVAERVDVGRVGVDVLAERVRVLKEEAERRGVVGGRDRAGRGEVGVLAARDAGGVLDVAPDDNALEDRLRAPGGLGDALADHGVARSSA